MKTMKEDLIKIGLHYQNQVFDLQIPRQISLIQLKQNLKDALVVVGINLPEQFDLNLIGKSFNIDQHYQLSDYAIGNGDQLQIIEDGENMDGTN